jgi:hypothetical protein
MNLDEELRDLLTERAAGAPDGAGLLAGVQRRSHRLAVHRRIGVAAVAAGLVLLVLVPWALLGSGNSALPPAQPGPSVSVSPSPADTPSPTAGTSAVPGSVSVTTLQAGQLDLPVFPFVPGWKPDGTTFTVGRNGTLLFLTDEAKNLRVGVDTVPYDWDWEAANTTGSATVNGRPASVRTGLCDVDVSCVGVTWQLADGRWVTVDMAGTTDQALRLARGLRAGRTPAALPPVVPHLLPVGFELGGLYPDGFCLSPSNWPPATMGAAQGLCVFLHRNDPTAVEQGIQITLGGHPGLLAGRGTVVEFTAPLADGRMLMVGTFTPVSEDGHNVPGIAITNQVLDQFVGALEIR